MPAFHHVDSDGGEGTSDVEALLGVEIHARSLHSFTKGRVDDLNGHVNLQMVGLGPTVQAPEGTVFVTPRVTYDGDPT